MSPEQFERLVCALEKAANALEIIAHKPPDFVLPAVQHPPPPLITCGIRTVQDWAITDGNWQPIFRPIKSSTQTKGETWTRSRSRSLFRSCRLANRPRRSSPNKILAGTSQSSLSGEGWSVP